MPQGALLSRRAGLALLEHAVAGLLLVLSLREGSLGASQPSPPVPRTPRVDSSAFLKRTMPIGNLGSVTCNARRYAFNAAWTLLAAPQDSGSVRLFDVATGQSLPPLEGGFKVGTFTYMSSDDMPMAFFAFTPDDRSLVWSWGKKVVMWDVASQKVTVRREVPGSSRKFHFSLLGGAYVSEQVVTAWPAPRESGSGNRAESPDGRLQAFVNADNDVVIRDARDPSAIRVLPGREKSWGGGCVRFDNDVQGSSGPQLLFSLDGRLLCDSCQITDVWDISEAVPRLVVHTGRLRQETGRPVLSQDGRTLAYPWGSGSRLKGDGGFGLVDVASTRPVGPLIEVKSLGAMAFSPDGTELATVGWVPRPGMKRDFEVQIWNVEALRSGGW